jgi:hypothetical protein
LWGAPHKVSANLGGAANQLSAAKRKGGEIAAKLQVSREVSMPAQLTSLCQEFNKPSNGSSVPVDLASAMGNILAACGGLPALVSIPEDTTMSNVGQVESVLAQGSSVQGSNKLADGTMESANLSPVLASTPVIKQLLVSLGASLRSEMSALWHDKKCLD